MNPAARRASLLLVAGVGVRGYYPAAPQVTPAGRREDTERVQFCPDSRHPMSFFFLLFLFFPFFFFFFFLHSFLFFC